MEDHLLCTVVSQNATSLFQVCTLGLFLLLDMGCQDFQENLVN